MDSNYLLDAVKSLKGIHSDYKLAKFLSVSQTTISSYRKNRRQMDDETAIRVASILGLDPAYVLMHLHAARTDCPAVRSTFLSAAKRLETAA